MFSLSCVAFAYILFLSVSTFTFWNCAVWWFVCEIFKKFRLDPDAWPMEIVIRCCEGVIEIGSFLGRSLRSYYFRSLICHFVFVRCHFVFVRRSAFVLSGCYTAFKQWHVLRWEHNSSSWLQVKLKSRDQSCCTPRLYPGEKARKPAIFRTVSRMTIVICRSPTVRL
jgi:hypothetical protein